MTQQLIETTEDVPLVRYDVTIEAIRTMGEQYASCNCDTREDEEKCREARMIVRSTRTSIEKRRKQLNEKAQEHIRNVNGVAKQLTEAISPIEDDLDGKIKAVEAERERIKAKEAARKQAEIDARIAAAKAEAEAEARALREAEEKRLSEERAAEQARLAQERAELEAREKAMEEERARQEAALAAERARFEAERAAARDAERVERARRDAEEARERARLDQLHAAECARIAERERAVEAERLKLEAEKAERERIEREKAEAEEAARIQAELEAQRLAMLPDVEKLRAYVSALGNVPLPEPETQPARDCLANVVHWLGRASEEVADLAE